MALVDYSSSNSASQESLEEPPAKRQREAVDGDDGTAPDQEERSSRHSHPESRDLAGIDGAEAKPKTGRQDKPKKQSKDGQNHSRSHADMPPLPSAFHDLYASTVRQSVADDPSLHQGRKRQTPHIPGNWPSHVYIEWHPTTQQHDMLAQLLGAIEAELGPGIKLTKFALSDLGAPLPLHISLSRPLSLTTANKDAFLDKLETTIRSRAVPGGFSVAPVGLAWYKSPDSNRLFLIVRVGTRVGTRAGASASASSSSIDGHLSPSGSRAKDTAAAAAVASGTVNRELATLLRRCNGVAAMFDQPRLYQKGDDDGVDSMAGVGEAFHVSVGWTFDVPSTRDSLRSLSVFKEARFQEMTGWDITVAGVKVKIGNVVHHVPLGGKEGRPSWSRQAVSAEDGGFKG